MINPWARDRATLFYASLGILGLTVIALGFGVTYLAPMTRGTYTAPWFVHLHGASALGWVLLLLAQARLVRSRHTPRHRRVGVAAVPLAALIWATGIATALWATQRDLPAQGTVATSSLAGTVIGLTLYLLLVVAAIVARRRPDWHKRFVLLATIQLLWPAFFRLRHWLPAVPNPEIWFALVLAYAPVAVAALRDRVRYGRVHPVWLYFGMALVVEQSLEVAFFDRGPSRAVGQWLHALLT
jgi:uncharacterized membrane protein YozB (DUF420 family)